jgi:AraC-like DNA-binding protein
MAESPHLSSDRPESVDINTDVVTDILETLRLTTRIFGRFELGAPWAMQVPKGELLSFYVVARGSAWLELVDAPHDASYNTPETVQTTTATLSAGDVVLLPSGAAHRLHDPSRVPTHIHHVNEGSCPRPDSSVPVRFGGTGPVTSFMAGAFELVGGRQGALLQSLPPLLHMPGEVMAKVPQLAATVQLLLAESASVGIGTAIISARLADILLLQILRTRATPSECAEHGLTALADPAIGASLRSMHGRIDHPWTVESLARAVGMSRSAYSARFTELVGESPLQYLTRWRMTKAAQLLRDRPDAVSVIAERVGYGNAAAFMKAFARTQGMSPGAYRRLHRDAG